jgi:ABC-type branched-subunit amino acid transport system ATPase component
MTTRSPAARSGSGPRRDEPDRSLEVDHVTVRFGGLIAVDDVSLRAPAGRVTGLIGSNGAGKTTLFDACTGVLRPAQGRIRLFGDDVTRQGSAARAQRGLSRTFQIMQLFDSFTVRENLAMGREAHLAGSRILRGIFSSRDERREIEEATEEALDLCGLRDLESRPVALLSTGQRRLVELARIVAGGFSMLLLDEPSSGLDRNATRRFGKVLRELVDARGVGILLVEHDMRFVMDVCDTIYVLDFGSLILEGTPDEVAASETVRRAYLGVDLHDAGTS